MSRIAQRPVFSLSRLAATALVIGTANLSFIGSASAQCASPPPVNAATMAQFNTNPSAYLSAIAPGGALVGAIRNLAVSDPSVVSKITDFATTNPGAKGDIGTGLGQAAKICVPTQASQAQALQQAIINLNDPIITTAFLAVTGDIATTATGGGAGGGGGGGPGGAGINASIATGGTGGTFSRTNATSTTPNGVFSFSPGSGSTVSTTTNAITAATAAASP